MSALVTPSKCFARETFDRMVKNIVPNHASLKEDPNGQT